jgi:hypothetical protein
MILAESGNRGCCRFRARLLKGFVFAISPQVAQR